MFCVHILCSGEGVSVSQAMLASLIVRLLLLGAVFVWLLTLLSILLRAQNSCKGDVRQAINSLQFQYDQPAGRAGIKTSKTAKSPKRGASCVHGNRLLFCLNYVACVGKSKKGRESKKESEEKEYVTWTLCCIASCAPRFLA